MINSLALRGGYCLIRYLRKKDDKWNSILAGVLCGLLSMPFLKHNQWYLVLSIIAARIVESFYRIALNKGLLKEENTTIHYLIMFAIGNLINAYGYFIEGDIIESDMVNLYRRMAASDVHEQQWTRSALMTHKAWM